MRTLAKSTNSDFKKFLKRKWLFRQRQILQHMNKRPFGEDITIIYSKVRLNFGQRF